MEQLSQRGVRYGSCSAPCLNSSKYSGALSTEDTTGTPLAVLYTVEHLYRGHHQDPTGCPVQRGVPNSKVDLYTALCGWDCRQCPH